MNRLMLLCCMALTLAGCGENPVAPDDAFVFPPAAYGTPEWDRLSTVEQLAALQIPEHILAMMSTEDLIQVYYDYPEYIPSLYISYSIKLFKEFRESFNGVQALLARENALEKMLDFYATLNVPDDYVGPRIEKDKKYGALFKRVEMFLGQASLLKNIDEHTTQRIFAECLRKFYLKDRHLLLEFSTELETTIFPLAVIIWLQQDENELFQEAAPIAQSFAYYGVSGNLTSGINTLYYTIEVALQYLPDWASY